MVTPRVLLRLKTGLQHLDPKVRAVKRQVPADVAWQRMLRRLDVEESERRLSAVETALNGGAER